MTRSPGNSVAGAMRRQAEQVLDRVRVTLSNDNKLHKDARGRQSPGYANPVTSPRKSLDIQDGDHGLLL